MRIYVPLDAVDDNPFQVRTNYGDVADLAARINAVRDSFPETFGLLQVPRCRIVLINAAIGVQVVKDCRLFVNGEQLIRDPAVRVQIAFGHRRLRAFRYLAASMPEYNVFPVDVSDMSDVQMLDAVWEENQQRSDIPAVEQAELLAEKLREMGTHAAVAEAWGLSRATVTNKLSLLDLPEEIQNANRNGKISERTALAVAPVLEIKRLTKGNNEIFWGKSLEDYMPAPDAIVYAVLEGRIDSERVRKWVAAAVKHAGLLLPGCIAEMNAHQGGSILRSTCKGCRSRMNGSCFVPECMAAKSAMLRAQEIQAAGEVLGIPFSDRREDFPDDYEEKKLLQELWLEKKRDANFVYGWRVNESAVRPFSNDRLEFLHRENEFAGDGRAAIAIGHRGALSRSGSAPEQPPGEMVAKWQSEFERINKEAEAHVKTFLRDFVLGRDDRFMGLLQAMIRKPEATWIYDIDGQIRMIFDYLLRGSGAVSHINDVRDVRDFRAMLRRAGLDDLTTGTRATDMRRDAVLALHFYWCTGNYNRSYNYNQVRPFLDSALAMFDAAAPFSAADAEYTQLHEELRRAIRHMLQVLQREAK